MKLNDLWQASPVQFHKSLSIAPGVEAMEQLFQRLDDVLFCIKDSDGR